MSYVAVELLALRCLSSLRGCANLVGNSASNYRSFGKCRLITFDYIHKKLYSCEFCSLRGPQGASMRYRMCKSAAGLVSALLAASTLSAAPAYGRDIPSSSTHKNDAVHLLTGRGARQMLQEFVGDEGMMPGFYIPAGLLEPRSERRT